MKRTLHGLLILSAVLLVTFSAQAQEYRGLYVNAWSSGFESSSAVTSMINYAKSCNLNVVVPEIRLRADAYYTSSIEPPGTGVTPSPPGFDSLADMLTKGHSAGIEIHPWVVTYRIWTTTSGPPHTTPEHIWYTHGPGNSDPANDWLMYSDTGSVFADGISNLDPGHPAVEDYLITVFMDIVNRYNVDGFVLDYIRYPGTTWGYNPVSVARFNAEYGRTGNPSSSDTLWQDWRRDQISNLVKRLYLEIKSVKPWVKLGASVWKTAASGNSGYFQDWDTWMKNHWIDYVSPMMYTADNSTFHSYIDDAVPRQYGHHIYPLIDASNGITANVLPQIDLVRSHGLPGMALYCYSSIPDRTALKNALIAGPFPTFVSTTDMPWLSMPTKGYLKGYVRNSEGNAIYPATVTIMGTSFSTKNSGTGFYGFSEVTPGMYTVKAEAEGYLTSESPVTITSGLVSDLNFTLQLETDPPIISNVRAENIQATNAQIKWDTNEPATSQVDYGLTTSYGTTTPEDMARVKSHTVQLTGLTPLTTYHFRVRSYDAARNMSESVDYTFTTADRDTPVDIIVDNSDPGCTLSGSWLTGTSSTDKYGPNYFYCSGYTQGKTATWRPNVITPGRYNVYAWWPQGSNRTTHAPYFVQWNGGSQNVSVNQQINGGKWNLLVANVPFAAGTNGYVRLSNNGVETNLNVMADAIRLEWVDTEPPTAPTNLTATAISASQISLSWTASTDNIGVAGYKIYRNGLEVGTSASNSYVDSGLAANTQYSYYVKAYDAAQNISDPSNTVARYTLSVAPGAGSVTCDKPAGEWQATATFTFTAVGGFGAGKIQYYRYAWNQNSSHSWTGFETQWASGNLAQTATSIGSWYLHVKGYNADHIANGNYTYGPFKYDSSPPQIGSVTDDGAYTDAAGQLHATWTGSDPESGIAEYQYAVGTAPENIGSVLDWTSAGTNTSATTSGLTLSSGTAYYIGVKARNGAGAWSTPTVSDGITAADVVATIAQAKGLQDGKAVILENRVVSANFGAYFYICESKSDPTCGIRVNGSSPTEGNYADVSGILQTISGERVLTSPHIESGSGPGAPNPVFMTDRAVGGSALNDYTPGVAGGTGLNNIGLLIAVAGEVTNAGAGYFVISDGVEIKVDTTMLVTKIPIAGNFVRVAGISSTEQSGAIITPLVRPRGDADVVIYP